MRNFFICGAMLGFAGVAQAAVIQVNSTADNLGGGGNHP